MKKSLLRKKKHHIKEARNVKKQFVNCVEQAADGLNGEGVFTFELQTFEMPFIDNEATLKFRPLWMYCLCVYDETRKKSHLYTWDETVAGRGSEEISSCLYKHLLTQLVDNAVKVIFYSDPCNGQNRNSKITMMLQNFFVNESLHTQIQELEQRFFLQGHTFNSCTRTFVRIRKQMKANRNVFGPEHWNEIISNNGDQNLVIIRMKREDFYSVEHLEDLIVKRKKTVGEITSLWSGCQTIIYDRNEPFVLKIKEYSVDDQPIKLVSLPKTCASDEFPDIYLNYLNEESRAITKAKYNDLIELLEYIPDQYHSYYKSLKYLSNSEVVQDFGLTFQNVD